MFSIDRKIAKIENNCKEYVEQNINE